MMIFGKMPVLHRLKALGNPDSRRQRFLIVAIEKTTPLKRGFFMFVQYHRHVFLFLLGVFDVDIGFAGEDLRF